MVEFFPFYICRLKVLLAACLQLPIRFFAFEAIVCLFSPSVFSIEKLDFIVCCFCVRDCNENPFAFSAKDCNEKPDATHIYWSSVTPKF